MPGPEWIEIQVAVPEWVQEEAALYLTEYSGRGVILEDELLPAGLPGLFGVKVYFAAETFSSHQKTEIQQYLDRLESLGYKVGPLVMRRLPQEDWSRAWQVHFKPKKLTNRIVVRPPWGEYQALPGDVVLTIYPGMAFGTGRHASTLLCLQALEELCEDCQNSPAAGFQQALDVGTGTGILAFAAARLGAQVLAIDVDPEAIAAARENIFLNQLHDQVRVEDIPLSAIRQQFDLILANLTAPDLSSLAESLAGRLLVGGRLIISGLLHDDLDRLVQKFLALGLQTLKTYNKDEWVALALKRPLKPSIPARAN
jgi:ribosomal protein L11 methyltransferase